MNPNLPYLLYSRECKGFLDFCIYMGDYESAILPYQTNCPKNPPPVCDWLAIVFLRYCVQRDSEPVTDPNTDEPIEVRGQPLLSVQNWTGKSTIQNFQAALSMLHNQHDSTRQKYTEACPECQQISFEGIKKGESCGNLLLAARQRNHQPKIQATHQDYERVCKGKLLFQQCRLFPSFTLESHSQTPA